MDQAGLLAIAGTILGLIISLIKTLYSNTTGNPLQGAGAYWLTFILSFVTAAGILQFTGALGTAPSDPVAFAEWFGMAYVVVAGAAGTLYQVIISRETGVRGLLTKK